MDDSDKFDWDESVPESDFEEVEDLWIQAPRTFFQSWHDRLQKVQQNVEQEWPKLRDDKELNLLRNLRFGLEVSLTGKQNNLVCF